MEGIDVLHLCPVYCDCRYVDFIQMTAFELFTYFYIFFFSVTLTGETVSAHMVPTILYIGLVLSGHIHGRCIDCFGLMQRHCTVFRPNMVVM